jgi:UDP-N-acetylmuramate--alanine ligase
VKVYDDYGHHPTEIRATILAARENLAYLNGLSRLHVIFQPHRYTRTAALMEEFSVSFGGADSVVVLDIYAAGERPIANITSESLCERIHRTGQKNVFYAGDREEAVDHVIKEAVSGDIVLTLGAGDVWKVGTRILERLNGA